MSKRRQYKDKVLVSQCEETHRGSMQSQHGPSTSRQVRLPHRYRNGSKYLVLEDKSLDTLKHPKKNQEHADVLDPGELDGFPEARAVGGGGGPQLRQKICKATLEQKGKTPSTWWQPFYANQTLR